MSLNHLESWLTEQEAAELLHVSTRTLRRRCSDGEGPEKRERQRPGLRPEPVYNPEDVSRLAAPKAHVMPPETVLVQLPAIPQTTLEGLLARIAVAAEYRLRDAQPKPPARWLTLKQARDASGLSMTLLRRLVASGRLAAMRDGAIKVLQADLDTLDSTKELGQTVHIGKAEGA